MVNYGENEEELGKKNYGKMMENKVVNRGGLKLKLLCFAVA
jgi:hypothetical protein